MLGAVILCVLQNDLTENFRKTVMIQFGIIIVAGYLKETQSGVLCWDVPKSLEQRILRISLEDSCVNNECQNILTR